MAKRNKVFCIGYHKTGTTSLFSALTTLGYRVTGTVGHKLSGEDLAKNGAALCIKTMENFDAAEDMPWPHFFRELDETYPASKFILTMREPEAWYQSINNHFGHQETELNAFAYGRDFSKAKDNKDHWIKTFENHNRDVRDYFAGRPNDLLEMTLGNGDEWHKLCEFLECNVPDLPFPVKNTSNVRRSLIYRLKRKLLLLSGKTPHPELLQ